MSTNLVTVDWLKAHLDDPSVLPVDASWHLPATGRKPGPEFLERHIPGAQFFDVDGIVDPISTLPHTLPSPELFAHHASAMGIGPDTHVICYDTTGLFSAARLWWMLRTFGHANVSVLDGGLPAWIAAGFPLESGPAKPVHGVEFHPRETLTRVVWLRDLQNSQAQIVDARSPPRFRGEEQEPRPGVRPGHIPGARNVHYASLLNADGTVKDVAGLRTAFTAGGVALDKPIVTSCGSGITAAMLTLALEEIGVTGSALYDGSWADWGTNKDLPVETGPAQIKP